MELIEVNTKEKAEKIIDIGFRSHRMNWRKYYSAINNRETYLIWYEPKNK